MTDLLNVETKVDLVQAGYMLEDIKHTVDILQDIIVRGISRESVDFETARLKWNAGNSYLYTKTENFVETFNGFFDKFCNTGTKPEGDSE